MKKCQTNVAKSDKVYQVYWYKHMMQKKYTGQF